MSSDIVKKAREAREAREFIRIKEAQLRIQIEKSSIIQRFYRSHKQKKVSKEESRKLFRDSLQNDESNYFHLIYILSTIDDSNNTFYFLLLKKLLAIKPMQILESSTFILLTTKLGILKNFITKTIEIVTFGSLIIENPNITEPVLYKSGPELRFLLLYLDPNQYKSPITPSSSLIDHPNFFKLLNCSLKTRILVCFYLSKHTGSFKLLSSLSLWISAMIRVVVMILGDFTNCHQPLAIETDEILEDVFVALFSVPLFVYQVDDNIVEMFHLAGFVPRLLLACRRKNGFFERIFEKLNMDCEVIVFVVANFLALCQKIDVLYSKGILKSSNEITSNKTISMSSLFLDKPELLSLISPFLKFIQSQKIDEIKGGIRIYHPIFKWYSKSQPTGIVTKEEIAIVILSKPQIAIFWESQFIRSIFNPIIHFITPSKQTLPLLLIDIGEICSFYLNLIGVLKTRSKEILNAVAFVPDLCANLWRLFSSDGVGGGQGGLEVLLRWVEVKSVLIGILELFCETLCLIFLTLDDTDVYEKQEPFSTAELSNICSFLNKFCFKYYWNMLNISTTTNDNKTIYSVFEPAKRLLSLLYDRNCRRPFSSEEDSWLVIDEVKGRGFLDLLLSTSNNQDTHDHKRAKNILQNLQHCIPFKSRVEIFRSMISKDRISSSAIKIGAEITINRQTLIQDGFRLLSKLPSPRLKQTIKVTFISELGLVEAGIDQSGLFKDFLSTLLDQLFNPSLNLFIATPSQDGSVIPSASSEITADMEGFDHLLLFAFVGRMLGKALYEGIVIDIPFAQFIYAKILGKYCFFDDLPSFDRELYKSLTLVKRMNGGGEVEGLDLAFTIDREMFGKRVTVEIKDGGAGIPVTKDNRFEYVYLMADYRLNQELKEQFNALIAGFRSIVSEKWIRLFAASELQKLMAGENFDFDINDLKIHTRYEGGYYELHPTIRNFWKIIRKFSIKERKQFLKFVTSCGKPPVGGFQHLNPLFTIRFVPDDGNNDSTTSPISFFTSILGVGKDMTRLPTASTCFNLLKLPAFKRYSSMEKKLKMAILVEGFELS